jgi:CRP-like cAMP-binding protein
MARIGKKCIVGVMAPDAPLFALLRGIADLAALDDAAVAELARRGRETAFRPGAIVAREGAVSREAFAVVDGDGDVFTDGELVATVGPGDFVDHAGETARSATIRARTDMRVLVIRHEDMPAQLHGSAG